MPIITILSIVVPVVVFGAVFILAGFLLPVRESKHNSYHEGMHLHHQVIEMAHFAHHLQH